MTMGDDHELQVPILQPLLPLTDLQGEHATATRMSTPMPNGNQAAQAATQGHQATTQDPGAAPRSGSAPASERDRICSRLSCRTRHSNRTCCALSIRSEDRSEATHTETLPSKCATQTVRTPSNSLATLTIELTGSPPMPSERITRLFLTFHTHMRPSLPPDHTSPFGSDTRPLTSASPTCLHCPDENVAASQHPSTELPCTHQTSCRFF